MRNVVLIGGGEIGRGNSSYETKIIDEEIVKMTKKSKPNFLFIGLASSYSDSYYDCIKKIYKDLGCECVYLKKKNILNNPDIVKNKIESADIIYIGGGDTIKLLSDIKKYEIDSLLEKITDKGTVLVGISAGAILLSDGGFSDSLILRGESNKHEYIKGLGIVNISISPHYKSNVQKDIEMKEYLKNNKLLSMFCLENCVALKIVDNEYQVIKSSPINNAYLCNYNIEEKIVTDGSFNN